MVYKLVERDGVPVAKRSENKTSTGGRKIAVRRHESGVATTEVVSAAPVAPQDGDRQLVVPLVKGGELIEPLGPVEALARARAHHAEVRAALPPEAWALSRGEPVLDTVTA